MCRECGPCWDVLLAFAVTLQVVYNAAEMEGQALRELPRLRVLRSTIALCFDPIVLILPCTPSEAILLSMPISIFHHGVLRHLRLHAHVC